MRTQIIDPPDFMTSSSVFGQPAFDDHEQVVFCLDKDTGLKAIISIHSTVLGPALGGTRMWPYHSEGEALNDVLRLSRGMTYKAAITGLGLGGGKAVIIGNSKTHKTPQLMRRFGEFVHSLGGKYYTAEDVGMTTADMEIVREVTPYATGISEEKGGAGNPSPNTAYGVYMGMKAAARFRFGTDDLADRHIYVQGIGHVGESLVKLISEEGARVVVSDLNKSREQDVSRKYGTEVYTGSNLYSEEMDIYAPCALGATINDSTLELMRTKIIAGAANNQLEDEQKHGLLLKEKGIVYAPDFLINAGGIINVFAELERYSKDEIQERTKNIYSTTLEILKKADAEAITAHAAAMALAHSRLAEAKSNRTS